MANALLTHTTDARTRLDPTASARHLARRAARWQNPPKRLPRGREVAVRVLASSNIDDIHAAEGTLYGGIPIGPWPSPGRPVTPGSDLAESLSRSGMVFARSTPATRCSGVQAPYRAGGGGGTRGGRPGGVLSDPRAEAARRAARGHRGSDRRHRRHGGAACPPAPAPP